MGGSASAEEQAREAAAFDIGHNKGLISTIDNGRRRPPTYYAESNPLITYAKVWALAFVAILPYYAVLDQLGAIDSQSFLPCNEGACHYMRFFQSQHIPSTSSVFIAVQNGVSRPIALKYDSFTAYTCEKSEKVRTFQQKASRWNEGCPPDLTIMAPPTPENHQRRLKKIVLKNDDLPNRTSLAAFDCDAGYDKWEDGWSEEKKLHCCMKEKKGCQKGIDLPFLKDHEVSMLALSREQGHAEEFSLFLRITFYITKFPFMLLTHPLRLIAQTQDTWGMEHIPNGICRGKNKEEMQLMCAQPKQKKKIVNHLRKWGLSKICTVLGLVGWAFFAGLHDFLLLRMPAPKDAVPAASDAHECQNCGSPGGKAVHEARERNKAGKGGEQPPYELVTLRVGTISTMFMGLSVGGVFLWAMGASEAFVAPIDGYDEHECMCFYEIPHMTALVALATPLALLAAFSFKVQMHGMAGLFGDHCYSVRFDIPHYLAKQSFLWSWGVLVSPKLAGTYVGTPRETFLREDWAVVYKWQQALFYWRHAVLVMFWLSAASFMVSSKELVTKMLLSEEQTWSTRMILKYVVLPAPSALAIGLGAFCILQAKEFCFPPDGHVFTDHLQAVVPTDSIGLRNWLERNEGTVNKLGGMVFVVPLIVIGAWTFAVTKGLSPDLNFLLGREEAHGASLAQCELWGACGFIFIGVHVQAALMYVSSTWDDLLSLKRLAFPDEHKDHKTGKHLLEHIPASRESPGPGRDEMRDLIRRDADGRPLE
eukprot:TRINITY_DN9021_c0_g1_i4.p1 TRINITY_DN9021_c0_g1~~TRINITY_DN9021_c0_g1_i4.p1  ORF type:complete len:762 (-),score=120.13 TRINITY_DN9021_c0_g1_i4:160-2445(-)